MVLFCFSSGYSRPLLMRLLWTYISFRLTIRFLGLSLAWICEIQHRSFDSDPVEKPPGIEKLEANPPPIYVILSKCSSAQANVGRTDCRRLFIHKHSFKIVSVENSDASAHLGSQCNVYEREGKVQVGRERHCLEGKKTKFYSTPPISSSCYRLNALSAARKSKSVPKWIYFSLETR